MRQSYSNRASISALILAVVAGTAAATNSAVTREATQAPEATVQQAGQGDVIFVAIPGSMEFSGQLIVKPLQFEELADRGLDQRQITSTIARAKAILAEFVEVAYEPLVDHHVIVVPSSPPGSSSSQSPTGRSTPSTHAPRTRGSTTSGTTTQTACSPATRGPSTPAPPP